jgi:hypothetical protein
METGNSRKTLVLALEATLRRLGTDYLDLYWAHWPDFVTPAEEIVATFDDLVRQYERLDRVSAPILGILHEGANNILNSIFGGRLGQFDRLSAAS